MPTSTVYAIDTIVAEMTILSIFGSLTRERDRLGRQAFWVSDRHRCANRNHTCNRRHRDNLARPVERRPHRSAWGCLAIVPYPPRRFIAPCPRNALARRRVRGAWLVGGVLG